MDVITGFVKQIKLQLNWKLLILGFCLFPFLLYLGFWQLDRAAEKQIIIETQQYQRQLPAIVLNERVLKEAVLTKVTGTPAELNHFRRVEVAGVFDQQRYWLLDNKIRAARPGYEVIGVLQLEPSLSGGGSDGVSVLLVNLGWLPAAGDRTRLPEVKLPRGKVNISGHLSAPSLNAVFDNIAKTGWPKRVLQLSIDEAEAELSAKTLSSVLLIDANDPLALVTNWKSVNQSPEKHHGYAVQWFAMSFALMIALILANTNLIQVFKAQRLSRAQNED